MAKKKSNKDIIEIVTKIRSRNNRLWMSLLKLALEKNPRKATKTINKIVKNDRLVSEWMEQI